MNFTGLYAYAQIGDDLERLFLYALVVHQEGHAEIFDFKCVHDCPPKAEPDAAQTDGES